MKPLYLDDTASMRIWPEVTRAMNEVHAKQFGNPSSVHKAGEDALAILQNAKHTLAKEIGAKPHEVYITSGGTESNNWVIQGLADAHPTKKTIIVSAIEHPSVLAPCTHLAARGYRIIKLPVTSEGIVSIDALQEAVTRYKDVLCVSVMHVNNVIGTIQPIAAIGALCRKHTVLFHTDACQSFGKLVIDVSTMNIDLLSACAHKLGGPKGVGFLYVREKVKISPLLFGGGQEKGLRSGTENVAGVVGFACALAIYKKQVNRTLLAHARDALMKGLETLGGVITGSREQRTFNNIHVRFSGIESDTLVMFLSEKGIYVSSGSACDARKGEGDEVLTALGIREKKPGAIRITLPLTFTQQDRTRLLTTLATLLRTLKK